MSFIASGNIGGSELVKVQTDYRVAAAPPGATKADVFGVSYTGFSASDGESIDIVQLPCSLYLKTDGVGTILLGDPLVPSLTVPGAVMVPALGELDPNIIGHAMVGCAATPGLTFFAFYNSLSASGGTPGPEGPEGPAGVGIGLDGNDGADGERGPPGIAGAAGVAGAPGTAGASGPPGNEGEPGEPGLPGPPGIAGVAGTPGTPGGQGAQGVPGPPGPEGSTGDNGDPGPPGPPGVAGSSGPAGSTGPIGRPGLDADPPEEPMMIPGAPGPAGSAGPSAVTRVSGSSGAAGADITLQTLTANATANATTTLATVMTTTSVGVGTWGFKYLVVYQAAATTTGVDFAVNHTGTLTRFVCSSWFVTTGGAAANGLADQVASNTANMVEGKSQRTKDSKIGSSLGVDTLNADMLMVIEGLMVVSVTGSIELRHASEVAASSQVMANTSLELTKIA